MALGFSQKAIRGEQLLEIFLMAEAQKTNVGTQMWRADER